MSLKFHLFFKISICIWLFVIPKSMVSQTSSTQTAKVSTVYSDSITIHRIYADEQQNLIKIHCSFLQKAKADSIVSGNIKTQVYSKKRGKEVSHSMYVKNTEMLSENSILINLQPSLKDAIYGVEKRDFTVQFIEGDTIAEVVKTAILSNSIQLLDLRSYTVSGFSENIRSSIFILVLITIALLLAIPIIRKYNFKKYHIKKYKQITSEDKAQLDPFTFESIEENDEVVIMNDQLILLRSWKRVKALEPEDRNEALKVFFSEDDEKSHLFKPLSHKGRRVNRIWFGMMGAYIAWILYMLLVPYNSTIYPNFLSPIFDDNNAQFSTIIYGDIMLAVLFGLSVGVALMIAEKVYGGRKFSFLNSMGRLFGGAIILTALFMLQFILNVYIIGNGTLGYFITWMCVGIGIGIAFGMHTRIRKIIIMAIVLGGIGFIFHQMSMLRIVLDTFNTQVLLLFNLLLLGSVAGGLSYKKAIVTKEVRDDKSPDVVDDGNNMAVQVN